VDRPRLAFGLLARARSAQTQPRIDPTSPFRRSDRSRQILMLRRCSRSSSGTFGGKVRRSTAWTAPSCDADAYVATGICIFRVACLPTTMTRQSAPAQHRSRPTPASDRLIMRSLLGLPCSSSSACEHVHLGVAVDHQEGRQEAGTMRMIRYDRDLRRCAKRKDGSRIGSR